MKRPAPHPLEGLVASTVIVNLKTDRALRGVLLPSPHPDLLRLTNAQVHEDGQAADADGELIVERRNVDFVQVLEPSSTWGA